MTKLPEGWKFAPLGRYVKIMGGFAFKSSDATTEGVRWLKIANVGQGHIKWNEQSFLPSVFIEEYKDFILKSGDMVVALTRPVLEKMLKIGVITEKDQMPLLNQRVGKLIFDKGIDKDFVFHVLRTEKTGLRINWLLIGTDPPNLSSKVFDDLEIAIPPLIEQRQIAGILKSWDFVIEEVEKLIETKREHKRALMQRLLTGKLRFPEFAGQLWPKLSADKIFKSYSKKGNVGEPLLAVMQDIGVVPRDSLDRKVAMPEGDTHSYKLVEPGDFVISLRSFQGGLEYSKHRGIVSPAYTVLKSICPIEDDFYKHYFKSYDFIGHLAVAVIGIRDGKQVSYDDFSLLKLPYPSIEEQRKIAAVLSTADREIDQLTQKLDAYKQQKKGLMQQLLTGKKRVKLDHKEAA